MHDDDNVIYESQCVWALTALSTEPLRLSLPVTYAYQQKLHDQPFLTNKVVQNWVSIDISRSKNAAEALFRASGYQRSQQVNNTLQYHVINWLLAVPST